MKKPVHNHQPQPQVLETTLYPIPSYAANIWLHGEKLQVGFPPTADGIRGHTITLKVGEVKQLLRTIQLTKKSLDNLANKAWDQDNERLATHIESHIPLLSQAYRQAAQFATLLDILRARFEAGQTECKIGTKGAPVNAQILKGYKQKLEANVAKRLAKERIEALRGNPEELLNYLLNLNGDSNGQTD